MDSVRSQSSLPRRPDLSSSADLRVCMLKQVMAQPAVRRHGLSRPPQPGVPDLPDLPPNYWALTPEEAMAVHGRALIRFSAARVSRACAAV